MTLKEIIKEICSACDKLGQRSYGVFFCGMTNNRERRRREHNVDKFIYSIKLLKKEYAENLLQELSDLGFDTGNQIGNGQDDSVYVYVYKKDAKTEEYLKGSFELTFGNTWYNENDLQSIPSQDGIYICIACDKKLTSDNKYQSRKLVYIGMTDKQGFAKRIEQHIAYDHKKWSKYYDSKTEQLVYALAPKDCDVLQTIEAALIHENQPEANTEYMDHYQGEYDEVTVTCKGFYGGKLKDIIESKYQ